MPSLGKRWYHVTIGTHNSWLPGDPRGFRSRDHKIHSSGDHKNPPPKGEHEGLQHFSQSISGSVVILPSALRETIGNKMIEWMQRHGHQALVICVGGMHVHLLAELPSNNDRAKEAVGIAKKTASQVVREQLPGRIWARECGLKPIRDEEHQRNTFFYIQRHVDEGAFVWTFRDEGGR